MNLDAQVLLITQNAANSWEGTRRACINLVRHFFAQQPDGYGNLPLPHQDTIDHINNWFVLQGNQVQIGDKEVLTVKAFLGI